MWLVLETCTYSEKTNLQCHVARVHESSLLCYHTCHSSCFDIFFLLYFYCFFVSFYFTIAEYNIKHDYLSTFFNKISQRLNKGRAIRKFIIKEIIYDSHAMSYFYSFLWAHKQNWSCTPLNWCQFLIHEKCEYERMTTGTNHCKNIVHNFH